MDPTRYAIGLLLMSISLLVMTLISLFVLSASRRRSTAELNPEE